MTVSIADARKALEVVWAGEADAYAASLILEEFINQTELIITGQKKTAALLKLIPKERK